MNKPRILVVEDNVTLQRLIALLADRCGVTADVVSNGTEALRVLGGSHCYSMVLMDWVMPDMDGLECTRRIRDVERPHGRHVPIIAMTGNAAAEDRRRCLESGMDDYMAKPFMSEDFRNVLDRWLNEPSQSAGH